MTEMNAQEWRYFFIAPNASYNSLHEGLHMKFQVRLRKELP